MKIHYFQRYHQKENVATANTMLLLSRLYSYSSDKFFKLLKTEFFFDSFEPEISFELQEKAEKSVPDATITQESFKLVVEAKTHDWFYIDQLMRHLKAFNDEKHKVLITISSELMNEKTKAEFTDELKKHNENQKYPVIHINITFEKLAEAFRNVIDERDSEIQDVLDDYLDYCYNDSLIVVPDSWKWMRCQLAGTTINYNIKNNLYYDSIIRGFSAHDYLGLYSDKSIKAIGKITDIITAVKDENGVLVFNAEKGELTDNKKSVILDAIEDSKNYGYILDNHRYFFVEKFYETDFKKVSPRGLMGTKFFDLSELLNVEELPSVAKIAEELRKLTWS
jgi:hypothetical protein